MSLIDEALKRAQAMDRAAPERPSAWTPTHLPDRRPRTHRAVAIAAGLLFLVLIVFGVWRGLPKTAASVPVAAAAARPPVAAVPPADAAAIPPSETVVVAPPPRGISDPRSSVGVPSERPVTDRRTAKAPSSGPTEVERALPTKPVEETRAAPAKREAIVRADDKLADGHQYTGEILLGDDQKIALDGIVYSDTNPVALINGMVIAPGQAVDGMTVAKIEPDRVVLEGRGVTVFLLLK
ncbi:MAG TPA: hypothetical protein VF376_01870 [Thermoanaerobaculia bacterium]